MASCSLHLSTDTKRSRDVGQERLRPPIPCCNLPRVSYRPVDDLFIVAADENLLLWRDDAERVPLARPRLSVADVCAQIHVHGPLRQSAGLGKNHIEF